MCTKKTISISLVILLLLSISSLLFAGHTAFSQTVVVKAYIPPRTTIIVDDSGTMLFSSSDTNVALSVVDTGSTTLLNVTAR